MSFAARRFWAFSIISTLAAAGLVWQPSPEGAAAAPIARNGAKPVERPLPAEALPRHGAGSAADVPVEPPGTDARRTTRKADTRTLRLARSAAARVGPTARTAEAEAGEGDPGAADRVLLRPGYLLGDTSLVVYFDAAVAEGDPESWARWWVTVVDVESGTEQRSVDLDREDLDQARCSVPRTYCRSFGAADGWNLEPEHQYRVTITTVLPDGDEATSALSPEAAPRVTDVPPAIPAAQAGCSCPNVFGRSTPGQALRGALVNTATGAFMRTERDLGMPSFGIPFEAIRFYSSATPTSGMFGAGWSWTYDARILASSDDGGEDGEGAVRVRAEDGAEAVYQRQDDGSYQAPPGVRARLKDRDGGGWTLTPPDQRVLTFDADGRLLSVVDQRGHGVTLTYGSDGLLNAVTDAAGRRVTIEQRTDVRAIRKITLPDNRSVQFDYENGRLAKVQDARGYTWQYRYDSAGRLNEVVNAAGKPDVRTTYGSDGRVETQTDALGKVTRFEWDATKQEATTTDPDGVGVIDGYKDNVLLYSKNANGDSVVRRYDRKLNENLTVDGKHNQRETRHDEDGNPVEKVAPAPFAFVERNAFDDRNNLTRHVDGRGNLWSYDFNARGEMTGQKTPEAQEGYSYTYDDRGLMTSRKDPRGKVTTWEYDRYGNRTAEIAPTGRRTEFTYDETGRLRSVVDPRGTVDGANPDQFRTRFVYDAQDRVIERHDPGKDAPWRATYNELGQLTVSTDPLSNSVRTIYDDAGRVVRVQSPVGNETTYTYTAAGRRSSATDGEGNRTSWTFDAQGRIKTERSPRGNKAAQDGNDELAAQLTTTFHYDYNGNLVRTDRPYPGGGTLQVHSSFDELDRPTGQVDELGATTAVGYDNTGNVTSMTDEYGNTLGYTYDKDGRRKGSTDWLGEGGAEIEYDDAGNPVRQVTATGGVITWTYDDDGRPLTVTEPRGNVDGADRDDYTSRMSYDQAGNLVAVRDPLGQVTRYGYDALNRNTSVTDAKGNVTRFAYDKADRLVAVQGPDASNADQSLRYSYNADGQVIRQTDPLGHSSSIEYDRAGRPVVATDPIGRRKEFVYDADSNLIEQVTARIVEGDPRVDPNREHRTIFNTYDTVGRLVKVRQGDDGPVYTYGYDAKGRLVELADPTGVREHTYDKSDRLTKVVRGDDVFEYAYDANGRLKSRTYPDGTTVTAGYDEGDRLTGLTAAKGGQSAHYAFGYDVADQLIRTTYPESTGIVERRRYDRAGALSSIVSRRGDDVVAGYELERDPVGNPTRITRTRGGAPGQPTVTEATAYSYDAANRLTAACYAAQTCEGASGSRVEYTYDLVGNRLSQKQTDANGTATTTYRYDAADQLLSSTTRGTYSEDRTFEYDLEGNQTRAGSDTFTYNLDHTLKSATVGGRTTSYTYDAAGLRIGAVSGEGAQRLAQSWVWDVNNPMPMLATEIREQGDPGSAAGVATASQSFVYDTGGSPLALLAPSGDSGPAGEGGIHSYLRDWLGGVGAVVSGSGTPEWAYDYDPFGNPRGEGLQNGGLKLDDAAPDNPLQFTGQYRDSTQGGDRYFMRARNYDPATGRFGGVDPIPNSAGPTAVSSYAYAANRPTVLTDPTGMDPDEQGDAGPGSGSGNPSLQAAKAQAEAQAPDAEIDPFAQQRESAQLAVWEAEGFVKQIGDEIVNLILDLVGFNDAKACVTEGDIVACISTALQAVPWGKLFKAARVLVKAVGVGKRLVEGYSRLNAARKALASIPKHVKKVTDGAKKAVNTAVDQAKTASAATKRTVSQVKDTARKVSQKAREAVKKQGSDACTARRPGKAVANSFVAGTQVVLSDGSTKAIDDLDPGDTVLATDPDTGATTPRQVTATITGDGEKLLVDLEFVGSGSGGGGPPAPLTATDGHPFWVVGQGWTDAGDLRAGDRLRQTDGTSVTVERVNTRTEQATVHNLTVDVDHTYYVESDATSVLVHNAGQRSDPEDVCPIGRYAQESIPARDKSQNFTQDEREKINLLGNSFGCHTCGTVDPGTVGGNFVPDHQPISAWVPDGTPQRLYPQCLPCSRKQAGWAKVLAPIMRPLYRR